MTRRKTINTKDLFAIATLALATMTTACTPTLDDNGYHTQKARYEWGHGGGMFGMGRGKCNENFLGGCGGVVDHDAYVQLGEDGKLLFVTESGDIKPYVPAGSVTIGPITSPTKQERQPPAIRSPRSPAVFP